MSDVLRTGMVILLLHREKQEKNAPMNLPEVADRFC